jgi:hypothetical protein
MEKHATRLLALLCLTLIAGGSTLAAPVAHRSQYDIQATVSLVPAAVDGTATILFTNRSDKTLRDAVVMLFPNRFSAENETTDLVRPMIHPEEEFDEGGISLTEVLDDGYSASYEAAALGVPGTAVRIAIAPLEPGASRRLRMRFHTTVPHRFGGFGEFERQLTLVGGWHPYLAALRDDGEWQLDAPPPLADFQVTLAPAAPMHVVLSGHFSAGTRSLRAFVPAVPYLSLIAAPRLLKATRRVGDTTVTLMVRPKRFSHRVVTGPDEPGLIMDAVEQILTDRPSGVPAPPAALLLIEAPLRLHLLEAGEGMVVFSDRLYQALGPLRGFHEAHLAHEVYRELLRSSLSARERSRDYGWVGEGLAHEMAHDYMAAVEPERRLFADWLSMFDFLAAVDRFEKVPKIPFVGSYFDQIPTDDPAGDRIMTFNRARPPGRVILSKVRDLVGAPAFREMLDICIARPTPFRECADAHFPERDLDPFIDQWIAPYPAVNYWIESVDFNQRDGESFRTDVAVRRESSRAINEPVTIRMRTVGGADVDLKWNSQGDAALLSEKTDRRVYQVYIDPDEELIETRRSDNAWLPDLEFLIDSADIEVSSTEFGFGASAVARVHHEYRRDLALTAFYTNRGVGVAVGPRFHFGTPIDPTLYRHNLYLYYSHVALDSDFDDRSQPGFVTTGNTASLGFRYDYTDVFYDQNPSLQRRLRVHGDWHDSAVGSDFDFATWGYEASVVAPLFTRRTLVGLQLINGFSDAAGGSDVPNQSLYSLGGARSIRGIGFGDLLGRNLFVVRSELRQSIYPEVNWNLQDILILRRTQFRVFAESGNVDNSAGRIYDPRDWAVGVGAGFGLIYDAAGFFPAVAYLEIATRVDDSDELGDIQVLFGTKQPF